MRLLRLVPKGLDSASASSKVANDVQSEAFLDGGCTAVAFTCVEGFALDERPVVPGRGQLVQRCKQSDLESASRSETLAEGQASVPM